MMLSVFKRAGWLVILFATLSVRADRWNYWGQVYVAGISGGIDHAQLATDGTNMYYSTLLGGVYCASLADQNFSPLPMTGFPLWDANTNTNGFAVWNLATTPQGTLVISGSPVNYNVTATNSSISVPPPPFNNALPVFYWWDPANQLWQAAAVTNKSYPYTANVANFTVAPDGSLWTASGYYCDAYRSTDAGRSYNAFYINARVPTNYFPQPFTGTNGYTFGKIFSIVAGIGGEIVVGTETGGFLHTTNNGQTWTSLDPNYADTNSLDPLGRLGDSQVYGTNQYGDFLCGNSGVASDYPGRAAWTGVPLIGYHPADGSYFNASGGLPVSSMVGPQRVFTTPVGESFMYMNQDYLLEGGVYRSFDGKNWTQFNQGSGLDTPFASFITNAVGAGDCITTLSNTVFIANGNFIYSYDTSNDTPPPPPVTNIPPVTFVNNLPPPVTNRPPVAVAQNYNLLQNTPAAITLQGYDADGDPLNFTVTAPPFGGILTGIAPALTYTPTNNFTGRDNFFFQVDDGIYTSAPVAININVNNPASQLPAIAFTCSASQGWLVVPTNVILSVTATNPIGIQQVNFYNNTNPIAIVTKAPYVYTWTNQTPGDYVLNARVVNKMDSGAAWAPPIPFSLLPAVPQLQIQTPMGTNISLSLPPGLTNFFVESAPDLAGPWTLCPAPPIFFTNGPAVSRLVTVPAGGNQFFRIMHP